MSVVNFISLFPSKAKALSIQTSPAINIHTLTGVQLLPNNALPYIQSTNTDGGVELEDWNAYIVDFCSEQETEITDYFLVDRVFSDTKGQPQIDWKLTNVPFDFGYSLVYLKVSQAIGQDYYSNVFMLSDVDSQFTTRLDYKTSETMQSIQVQMYFWQNLKSLEIGTYYETSTRNTVTSTIKSQKHKKYITPFISNDLMIKISDVFENNCGDNNLDIFGYNLNMLGPNTSRKKSL